MIADIAVRGEVTNRFVEWCRQVAPENTAKTVARSLGCSDATIEKLFCATTDRKVSGELLTRGARAWGWQFVSFVMEPAAGERPTPEMMLTEVQQARAELAEMDARFARLLEARGR